MKVYAQQQLDYPVVKRIKLEASKDPNCERFHDPKLHQKTREYRYAMEATLDKRAQRYEAFRLFEPQSFLPPIACALCNLVEPIGDFRVDAKRCYYCRVIACNACVRPILACVCDTCRRKPYNLIWGCYLCID